MIWYIEWELNLKKMLHTIHSTERHLITTVIEIIKKNQNTVLMKWKQIIIFTKCIWWKKITNLYS